MGGRWVSAALAALAASASAMAQDSGEDPACVDWYAPENAFDLIGAGAVISSPAFEREDARTDFAVFEDGMAVSLSAGFCTHPFYEMTASFPAPSGAEAARGRLGSLFAIMETAAGCGLGPEAAPALEPAVTALAAGSDFETEGGAPVYMD